jgi:hypothetical protein
MTRHVYTQRLSISKAIKGVIHDENHNYCKLEMSITDEERDKTTL